MASFLTVLSWFCFHCADFMNTEYLKDRWLNWLLIGHTAHLNDGLCYKRHHPKNFWIVHLTLYLAHIESVFAMVPAVLWSFLSPYSRIIPFLLCFPKSPLRIDVKNRPWKQFKLQWMAVQYLSRNRNRCVTEARQSCRQSLSRPTSHIKMSIYMSARNKKSQRAQSYDWWTKWIYSLRQWLKTTRLWLNNTHPNTIASKMWLSCWSTVSALVTLFSCAEGVYVFKQSQGNRKSRESPPKCGYQVIFCFHSSKP